jgi:phosphate transport system substrate-binding protein
MSVEDITAGTYPLDRHLLIYARQTPEGFLDPFVREYLRMILSREGQRIIAETPPGGYENSRPLSPQEIAAQSAPGYLPLNAEEVAAELARLP